MDWSTARTEREDMLRIAALPLTKTGGAFLPAVVQQVVRVFANVANVAELVGGERLRNVAVLRNGAPADDFEFAIADTPCQDLPKRIPAFFSADVKTRFPGDPCCSRLMSPPTSPFRWSGLVMKSSARRS